MGNITKFLIFIIALPFSFNASMAFTLPLQEIPVGDSLYIEETDILKHYAIFLPFEEPTNGEVCASMSGEELSVNNNLKDYGTCFINDIGTFTIVEIEEPFSSSYQDLLGSEQILQEETVILIQKSTQNLSEEIITDLDQFIEEAESEIDQILTNLVDGSETDEASSSTESQDGLILGAKTLNLIAALKDNFLIIFMIIMIISTSTLIIFTLKKDLSRKSKKK